MCACVCVCTLARMFKPVISALYDDKYSEKTLKGAGLCVWWWGRLQCSVKIIFSFARRALVERSGKCCSGDKKVIICQELARVFIRT